MHVSFVQMAGAGRCQTDSNRSPKRQCDCPLCCAELTPLGESSGTVLLEEVSGGEAALVVEVVRDRGMDGGEFLKTSHASEAEHCSLPSSKRKVRVLCAIVEPCSQFNMCPSSHRWPTL